MSERQQLSGTACAAIYLLSNQPQTRFVRRPQVFGSLTLHLPQTSPSTTPLSRTPCCQAVPTAAAQRTLRTSRVHSPLGQHQASHPPNCAGQQQSTNLA